MPRHRYVRSELNLGGSEAYAVLVNSRTWPTKIAIARGSLLADRPDSSGLHCGRPLMRFTYGPDDRRLEGYTIQQGLGRGGFGEVYQAVSDGGKQVALKLVQRNLDVELRGVGQCLNLKHPNLVSVYDVMQAENGDQWVVMEYVAGGALDQVNARHRQT